MKRSHRVLASAVLVGAIGTPTLAQYAQDFEGLTASAAGELLTGQDGYYIPAGTTSVDAFVHTYAGNPAGIPQNPNGGNNFTLGVGPANPTFARAQRDITTGAAWGTGVWKVSYDALCISDPAVAQSNNFGSFSVQPYPGSGSYIHLFSYVDLAGGPKWQAFYLGYDAAGTPAVAPGTSPGPEWTGLTQNFWYHFETTIDFGANQITDVSITDLSTGTTASATLVDVYLEGGTAGAPAQATGFRMFGGGTNAGNGVAWDNLDFVQIDAPCYADCDGSGALNIFDYICFGNAYANNDPYADCDGSGTLNIFDYICFGNEYANGCP
ncbi:MAG: hypothetical protein H6815_01675 [Phycisphaeraceae bacterium]|nr:hypothetical protein [Phycisphaerales bacterium]MCB9859137.1 hypothetical protein [Phycisphaeraceae bacterium]